jgi:septum formation protein
MPDTNKTAPLLPNLYLASQSPRRKQLLETLGLQYKSRTPVVTEETASAKDVVEVTQRNALLKAAEVQKHIVEGVADVVLGADTLVVLGNDVLGKPRNFEEAKSMLARLSGQTHRVISGISLLSKQYGVRQTTDESFVTFKRIPPLEIEAYARTREPHDKAGSYAVQGLGALLIEKIEGSYTNVMGLPIEAFLRELESLTQIPIYSWFC